MKNRRLGNRIMGIVLRIGAPFGPMAVLTVAGRTSGEPRSTPIAVVAHDGGWRLLATFGIGDWVRNLRAAGTATLTVRGTPIPVTATEIDPIDAAPFIRATVTDAGPVTRRIVQHHFDAAVDDPIEAWQGEAINHPLFQLTPLRLPKTRGTALLKTLTRLLILGIGVQVALAGAGTFGQPDAWQLHRTLGVATEAVSLAAAVAAISLRRPGVRWLTAGIFTLVAFQHGTAAIGGLAGSLHALNSLLMLAMAATVLRRLSAGAAVPAAPHAAQDELAPGR